MPSMPPRPCTKPGCYRLATKDGRCDQHQRKSWDHTKSRHERGYGNDWYKLRVFILRRDKNLCQVCLSKGIYTPATQVDHITPKALGGDNSHANLQSICGKCHTVKTQQEAIQGRGG